MTNAVVELRIFKEAGRRQETGDMEIWKGGKRIPEGMIMNSRRKKKSEMMTTVVVGRSEKEEERSVGRERAVKKEDR